MLIRLEKITVVGEFTYFRISAKNKTEIIYKLSVYKEMYRVCITVRFFELYCDGLQHCECVHYKLSELHLTTRLSSDVLLFIFLFFCP